MLKYYLFGAGDYGRRSVSLIGKGMVAGFIDNNKSGTWVDDIPVYALSDITINENVVIVVSVAPGSSAENSVSEQLRKLGVSFLTYLDLYKEIARARVVESKSNLEIYKKAINWIEKNSIDNEGIINNTNLLKSYPEVTGYYIPTLLTWGYRELATTYAKWLCRIQKSDGSWYDTFDRSPYVFDTAQILKGLIAIRDIIPEVDNHVIFGCDWIISNIQPDGRLLTPTKDSWGNNGECLEAIHLYCLQPLREAAKLFNKPQYESAVQKVLKYYKRHDYNDIINFHSLSHFYAYVMEALVDLGEVDIASEAMSKIAKLQKEDGSVPAYYNVDWVCSTGLFQFALVWYKLGDIEHGNKAFEYACKLQNRTGGWYGSYLSINNLEEINNYFPISEISWANKYFLDALAAKGKAEFEKLAPQFLDNISFDDERYVVLRDTINKMSIENRSISLKICDIGCGKGRYVNNLITEMPQHEYYVADISDTVMSYIKDDRIKKSNNYMHTRGTNLPYKDSEFDIVYACESLEHMIDIESAIREFKRILRPGGKMIIIDKNNNQKGCMVIGPWEQWFDKITLSEIMADHCEYVEVRNNLKYDNGSIKNLFLVWIGTKV